MLVIRVQTQEGWGMYCVNAVRWGSCDRRNPTTYTDMRERYQEFTRKHSDYRHGFNSIEMMWSWFHKSSYNVEQTMNMCKIAVYDIPDLFIEIGYAQVIFANHKARFIRYMSVEEFLWRQRNGLPITADYKKDKVVKLVHKPYLQFKQAPRSAKKYA